MTRNVTINHQKHTIEITKKFEAAAKKYGTTEYDDLQAVRRDYPRYRIVVNRVNKKTESYKGLTYDFMELFIKKNDEMQLTTFFHMCGKDATGKKDKAMKKDEIYSYGVVKEWFLGMYKEKLAKTNLHVQKLLMEAA